MSTVAADDAESTARSAMGRICQLLGPSEPLFGLRVYGLEAIEYLVGQLEAGVGDRPRGSRRMLLRHLALVASGALTEPLTPVSPLTAHLLRSAFNPSLIGEMWRELPDCQRSGAFARVFRDLHELMRRQKLTDSRYQAVLQLVVDFAELVIDGVRVFARFFVGLDNWHYDTDVPIMFERLAFLPAFLSLSPFASEAVEVAEELYPTVDNVEADDVLMGHRVIQNALDSARDRQYLLVYSLLRDSQCRRQVLALLWRCCQLGATRCQMQYDESSALSEGFLLSFQSVMWKLASKIPLDKVDREFLLRPDCPFPLKDDDARLNASAGEVADWRRVTSSSEATFNTHGFYLAGYAHHVGLLSSLRKYKRRSSNIREAERILETGEQAQNNDRIRAFVVSQKRAKLCDQAGIFHETLVRDAMCFYDTMADYLLAQVQYGASEQPKAFRSLPEYFVEDLCDLIILVMEHQPNYVKQTPVNNCFKLVATVLSHPHSLFRNPYLTAKFVEILFYLDPSVQPRLEHQFNDMVTQQCALESLVRRLVQFYVDVESTGASNEFYDKFSIRYHLAVVFNSLWAMSLHRDQFRAQAGTELFVKFINVLINDATYLLDESLGCLKRIREIQDLADAGFPGRGADVQTELRQELATNERHVKSYLTLTTKTVEMFGYLTRELPKAFVNTELVERLATMLNYNLKQLCGSKCNELKVRTPDKYGWAPRVMLDSFVNIYLNLASEEPFAVAIVNDERSYSSHLLPDALQRLRRAGIKTEHELHQLESLHTRTLKIANARRQEEMDFEDSPDEFLDEMMCTLMSDPVRLPTGQIVDRGTIRRHLLNSATNPYSKMPMTEADLTDLPELKARIAEWKAGKGGARSGSPMQH